MFGWINDGLYAVLNWIQSWAGYWGIAIILFTIMVRLCLTPLDIKSRASMRKTQKLQPQLQALQKDVHYLLKKQGALKNPDAREGNRAR